MRYVTEWGEGSAVDWTPVGDRPMTAAERQARFRAAHANGTPKVRHKRAGDRRSRPQRWRDAVAELVELQGDYQAWLDALPPSVADSTIAVARWRLATVITLRGEQAPVDLLEKRLPLTCRENIESGHPDFRPQ
jgi:hypothetical protein